MVLLRRNHTTVFVKQIRIAYEVAACQKQRMRLRVRVFAGHIASTTAVSAISTVKKAGNRTDSCEIGLEDKAPVVVKLKKQRVTIGGYPFVSG